ncbi:hypothetical protein [Cohnella sp. AR92]|uniref:hypothetical protein n=1 Tax=Cohnella sp. AR92 TaxID=648716 RepID=UPI000F8DBD80|nr:hypothetical protein [Cohnella sp. AR92]RUS47925.1 hypothetical protein ELR57_05135 [Cohnella sp. AR92]
MDNKHYYVSVQSKTIMHNQGDAPYELEIVASEEEVDKLKDLFAELDEYDQDTFFRAHYPGIPYHHDSQNDRYDYALKQIYGLLNRLGTEETKSHIDSMNLQMGAEKEF